MPTEQEYIARIRELESELTRTKKQKRYGLVWEDKKEDVVERCKNELPVLVADETKTVSEDANSQTHILIEGDNYHALSVLAYTHAEKVDVIYIDPPYNTGARDWKYNNDYVDSEDQFRHSKWIAMMSKRLEIAKKLLTNTGFVVLAIDHYEIFSLGLLCDEIFGEDNKIGVVAVVHKPEGRNQAKFFGNSHEYMLFYSKNKENCNFTDSILNDETRASFDLSDDNGAFRLKNFIRLSDGKYSLRVNKPTFWYPIYVSGDLKNITTEKIEGYLEVYPRTEAGQERTWKTTKDTAHKRESDLVALKNNNGIIEIYEKLRESEVLKTHWIDKKYHAYHYGTKLVEKILGEKRFDFPKSLHLLKDTLKILSDANSIVLDFFAGSGTTGHAVLELNKEDGGNRQFILCTNNENQIAEEVTYPRIRNVIKGYSDVEGIPANLRYYRTDFISNDKSIDDLRHKFILRCSEMLQVRESCFDLSPLTGDEYFQVFENRDLVLAILYHPYEIKRLKEIITQTQKPIVAYIFSMGMEIFQEELAEYGERIRIETVPDEILETYKKIFGF